MLFDYMGNSPSQDSQKSICGCCGSEVFAKTGVEKEWHWAHYSLDDCEVDVYNEKLKKKMLGKYGQIVSVNNEFGRDLGKLVAA
jgi:competence CoiA-like predicted nuclease